MSNTDNIAPESRPPAPPPRSGCLTAFMVIAGIFLLLPGLCTLLIGAGNLSDPNIAPIAAITFSVGLIGLILILVAIVRR
jgi:formate hydrogenlyase subunit 3/multisubunit Na+/H+ antiporter MnhD subunit